jgi:hypothetical protein
MTDYSKKNVLCIDTGMGSAHAERISRDVANCWYYTPTTVGCPQFKDYVTGLGLGNVKKVTELEMWKCVDKADLIYFLDIGFGGMAQHLKAEGHSVFGACDSEQLEFQRFKARKIQDTLGLPIPHTVQVKGIDNLRKHLKGEKDVYIKHDIYRGSRETIFAKDLDSVELDLHKLESEFWPDRKNHLFMVEDKIEGGIVEVGFDLFHNGTSFVKPYLFGIEHHAPYLGRFVDELPMPLKKSAAKLEAFLKKLNYRGAFSDEEIVVSEKKSVIIDWTCRYPFPLSTIFTEAIKNYTDVIFKVAAGEDVEIEPAGEYVGCLSLKSEDALNNWLELDYPENLSDHIKPVYGCKSDGKLYAVKGISLVICLISWGESLDDVVTQLKELMGEVNGYDIERECSALDDILGDVNTMKEAGLDGF